MTEAIIRSADDLIEAFRDRKAELGLSNEAIEQQLLWCGGMADKYWGPSRTKPITSNNIENILTLFGCELVLRPNPEARMRDLERRDERNVRDSARVSKAILERARHLAIPVVATNCPAYAIPTQRELLDVFTCVRHHTTLAAAGRLLERNSERHVKTPGEMARLFADLPEADLMR